MKKLNIIKSIVFCISTGLLFLALPLFGQQVIRSSKNWGIVDTTIYLPLRVVDPSPQYAVKGGYSTLKPPVISLGSVYDSIRIGDYENEWTPSIRGYLQDTVWIDTCVAQTWKIQVGLNQFALKDTVYCFKYPIVNGGGVIINDTIWLTNNVMYQGKQGIPGPTGPQGQQGPQGIPGVCPDCPSGGGGFFETGWINVQDYGAIPNDGLPDDAAFRAAVAAANQNGYRKLYIPAGDFNITYVAFPAHFNRWIIEGEGIADGGAVNEKFTRIVCENTQGPCFSVGAVRLARIRNIVFSGKNESKVIAMMSKKADTVVWRPENWVADGLSIDKFQHQSALAFDYGASVAPWSAQVIVENCKFSGFVVGISISPSAGNMQADTYWVRDTKFENNVYGISVGQDQCRSITFENVWMNQGYCAFVNNRFGRGNGSAFNVTGGQYTGLFKLFECTNAYRGQMSVNGLFAEDIGIIGSISGLGINTNSVSFTGCEIGLDDNGYNDGANWVTPFATMSAGGNIVFTGCNIHSDKKMAGFGGNQYQFIGTTFTETRPVFPNDAATVSITGRPLFNWGAALTDKVDVEGGQKKYVRYSVSLIQRRGDMPYNSVSTASNYIPMWWGDVWQPLPDTDAKTFEWPVLPMHVGKYKVGDFLDAQCKANVVPGLWSDFGQAIAPVLEVVEVKPDALVLQRVSPEVRVESWYRSGAIFTEPYIFITAKPLVAKSSGTNIEIENANLLTVGDFVSDTKSVARVLAINGDVVSFSNYLGQGILYSVR